MNGKGCASRCKQNDAPRVTHDDRSPWPAVVGKYRFNCDGVRREPFERVMQIALEFDKPVRHAGAPSQPNHPRLHKRHITSLAATIRNLDARIARDRQTGIDAKHLHTATIIGEQRAPSATMQR